MAKLSQEAEKGNEIVQKINAGLGLHEIDLSVEACGAIPVDKLAPGRALALSESIVAEIFRETRIPGDQASLCWDAMIAKMLFGNMLQLGAVQHHESWPRVVSRLRACNRVHNKAAYEHIGMPAPELAFIIAAFCFRKMKMPNKSSSNMKEFIEVFGDLNCMRWLPIAIKVHSQINGRVFLIELDERVNEPLVRPEGINGEIVMVVTTKKPSTNIYEAKIHETVRQMMVQYDGAAACHGPDNGDHPRKSIENADSDLSASQQLLEGFRKAESNDVPLESVPPSIKEKSLNPESQHEEDVENQPDQQVNSDTLRDHARQMKEFGKRLPSPDQKFVRRVRRDIRRFANLADEKEDEMILKHSSDRPSSSSGFATDTDSSSVDLFGRYKMLWKGSLRENGSIPESLRELVRHDCDPNQIFYLDETESDFLAANATRNDENGHARQ